MQGGSRTVVVFQTVRRRGQWPTVPLSGKVEGNMLSAVIRTRRQMFEVGKYWLYPFGLYLSELDWDFYKQTCRRTVA